MPCLRDDLKSLQKRLHDGVPSAADLSLFERAISTYLDRHPPVEQLSTATIPAARNVTIEVRFAPSGSRRRPGALAANDEAALLLMAQYVLEAGHAGRPVSERAAARRVVDLLSLSTQSPAAAEDRLRRKYRARRDEIEALVRA